MSGQVYQALIRTHHITSRKKVANLKTAAKKFDCYALLRSDGVPGVMYVRGRTKADVQNWVNVVHSLRYKDYQLIGSVNSVIPSETIRPSTFGVLEEVDTIKEFGAIMQQYGIQTWWRTAMGYTTES